MTNSANDTTSTTTTTTTTTTATTAASTKNTDSAAPAAARSMEEIKAAARAYALSGSTSKPGPKKRALSAALTHHKTKATSSNTNKRSRPGGPKKKTRGVLAPPPPSVTTGTALLGGRGPWTHAPYSPPPHFATSRQSSSLSRPSRNSTNTTAAASTAVAGTQPVPPALLKTTSTAVASSSSTNVAELPWSTENADHSQDSTSLDLLDLDDDYLRFVRVLGLDHHEGSGGGDDGLHSLLSLDDDDDEEEFQLDPLAEEDDDEDEEHGLVVSQKKQSLVGNDGSVVNAAGTIDKAATSAKTPPLKDLSHLDSSPLDDFETTNFYQELEEELGWLEQEDMEAAVATLLDHPPPGAAGTESSTHTTLSPAAVPVIAKDPVNGSPRSTTTSIPTLTSTAVIPPPSTTATAAPASAVVAATANTQSVLTTSPPAKRRGPASSTTDYSTIPTQLASTPLRDVARATPRTVVTPEQHDQLRHLLEQHHQLLLQQAVLTVRAANVFRRRRGGAGLVNSSMPLALTEYFSGCETAEELTNILDSAVEMLQDLNQNRKDAIRHDIQFDRSNHHHKYGSSSRRSSSNNNDSHLDGAASSVTNPSRTLFQNLSNNDKNKNNTASEVSHVNASLDRRLTRSQFSKTLLETRKGDARTLFDCPGLANLTATFDILDKSVEGVQKGDKSAFDLDTGAKACEHILSLSGAVCDTELVPSARDVSECFSLPQEIFGEDFKAPCTPQQESILRRNRNYFTSGEDNLVFRGVNLYGEKQWMLIADRYLPERSINIISQRHSKLCFLLYKANGISIDPQGNLLEPTRKLESADDLDEEAVGKLSVVPPPAILNVHRWSLEEDLTLLKAVPLMGSMWAELRARLIPHRDRGHLRKRYQVLGRRIKATVARSDKHTKAMALKLSSSQNVHSFPMRPLPGRSIGARPAAAAAVPPQTVTARPIKAPPTKKPRTQEKLSTSTGKPRKAVAASTVESKKTERQSATHSAASQPYQQPHPYPHPHHMYHPHYPPHYMPHMYYPPPPYAPLPYGAPHPYAAYPPPPYATQPPYGEQAATASRAAYENLANDHDNDWSQMSQLNKMMQDPDGSAVEGDNPNLENFLSKQSTGVTEKQHSPERSAAEKDAAKSVSLLASVLDRSSERTNLSTGKDSSKKKSPTETLTDSPSSNTRCVASFESPEKRKYPTNEHDFVSPETLLLLASPSIREPRSPSSPLKVQKGSPSSNLNDLLPDGSSPFFSRHADLSHNGHSMGGYDFSGMSFTAGGSRATSHVRTSLFGDGATLMETDLEAISALNSLSQSPAKPKLERPQTERETRKAKQSLFSQVVGNSKSNGRAGTKKRKLEK